MSTMSPVESQATHEVSVGDAVELARYRITTGESRAIVGQRINGAVRLSDIPADGHGRRYLIERQLEQDGYAAVKALVADYLEQATVLDGVPVVTFPWL